MTRHGARILFVLSTGLLLAGCTAGPGPSTIRPTTEPTTVVDPSAEPAGPDAAPAPSVPAPAVSPEQGALCDPSDSSPDCTNATVDDEYRYIPGYAQCVADYGGIDDGGNLCTDLDGDGLPGYPDE